MPETKVGKRSTLITRKIFFTLSIIIMLIVVLFPFVWMVLASFKKNADIMNVDKLIRFVNHPAVKWIGRGLLGGGALYAGYKITDNITSNGYDGSMDLLGLVKIDLTKHDKS